MRFLRKSFRFPGGKLFLSDMRPGFSEDGADVSLPEGEYRIGVTKDGPLQTFSLVLAGADPGSEKEVGTIDLDMARVGLFQRKPFLKAFGSDPAELFDWSSDASETSEAEWGGFLTHKPSGLQALYFNIGSDGQCRLFLLRSGSRTVGLKVVPLVPVASPHSAPPSPASARVLTEMIVAEVTWTGDTHPWGFTSESVLLQFKEFLSEVISEIVIDDIDEEFIDPDEVNPDDRISRFRPRFKGISRIELFRPQPHPAARIPIPISLPPDAFEKSASLTPRQLAQLVYDIIRKART